MTVRAKFRVDSVRENEEGLHTVLLSAVYDPDPDSENGRFWKYTPSGHINLGTVNRAAAEAFAAGKEFYVDFLPTG